MDFRAESVVELAGQVRSGSCTAAELVDHALDRIAGHNPTINAFVAVDEERARTAAAGMDAKVAAGRTRARWPGSRSGSRTWRTPPAS